jgi:hypothetical protein
VIISALNTFAICESSISDFNSDGALKLPRPGQALTYDIVGLDLDAKFRDRGRERRRGGRSGQLCCVGKASRLTSPALQMQLCGSSRRFRNTVHYDEKYLWDQLRRSYRTLRDGSLEGRIPRHFVPGYDRLVPPGPCRELTTDDKPSHGTDASYGLRDRLQSFPFFVVVLVLDLLFCVELQGRNVIGQGLTPKSEFSSR